MEQMRTTEQVSKVAQQLLALYDEKASEAGLSKTSAGAIVGLSSSAYSQLRKSGLDGTKRVPLEVFVHMKEAVERIQRGLNEGWLPATKSKGKPQQDAVEAICGYVPTE